MLEFLYNNIYIKAILLYMVVNPTAVFAQENRDVMLAEEAVGRLEVYAYYRATGEEVILGHGTAFLVNKNTLVTNEHVVSSYLDYIDRLNIRFQPSNSQTNIDVKVLDINKSSDLAILKSQNDIDATPLTLHSQPIQKGEQVYQLGYPSLVDFARKNIDKYDKSKNRLTQTRGEVTNFTGTNAYPTAYLHNADTAKGTSGGPLLNQCGQVVAVNANATSGQVGEAAYRGGPSAQVLIDFLKKNNVEFQVTQLPCLDRAEQIRSAKEEEFRLTQVAEVKKTQQKLETIELDRIERQEAMDKALFEYEVSWKNSMIIVSIIIIFMIGLTLIFLIVRNKLSVTQERIFLATVGLLIMFLIWRISILPSAVDFLPNSAPIAANDNDEITLSDQRLQCIPNLSRSQYSVKEPESIPFIWKNSGCIGRGTQYIKVGNKYEVLLMPKTVNVATHYIFDPVKSELVSERYIFNDEEARRMLGKVPESRDCTSDKEKLKTLIAHHEEMKALLLDLPSERIVYKCS